MTNSVLKDWVVEKCSWKEQTVLLCALRGADFNGSPELKAWTRKIRREVLANAAPGKTFMQQEAILSFKFIADRYPLKLDMLPVHFLSHLMHACQVLGAYHPQYPTRHLFMDAYIDLCDYLHVNPENVAAMAERLKDEIDIQEEEIR